MKDTIFFGIDFHKNKSVICALYQDGSAVFPIKSIQSKKIYEFFNNKEPAKLAIEASGGTNEVVSRLRAMGHEVLLVNSNVFRGIGIGGKKTDSRDAKALANYLRLGGVSEVHVKSLYSRNIKSLIVSREMVLRSKVNLMNHIRGTLKEYGILIPVGPKNFFKEAPQKIASLESVLIRETLEEILKTILSFVDRQKFIENQLKQQVLNNPQVELLQSIPGVGELGASMAVSVIDDISRFRNSREFASYLGLTPRVHSSADKRMMGSISKSGPEILRRYLIHGARAWMKYSPDTDPNRKWAEKVKERRGMNKATVALAHRMSRSMFAVMRDEVEYNGRKKKKAKVTKMAA